MTERSHETPFRIVFVGHVDHGKSTLVGRLFHDTGALPEGKLEQIQATCERRGVPFEWAFLMDALQAERDQNITIDTSQIWFRTERRPYVIIDAPGHREFLKNMITGAASADAAFLLIAANEGVREQSRRHGLMLSLLGIEQVVVLVNKLDLVDYAEDTFDQIEREYREFLEEVERDSDLRRDDVAEVVVESKSPIAVDRHNRIMAMGRFVLVDRTDLAGGGIVTELLERTDAAADRDVRPVAEWERYSRNGHRGAVVWLGPHAKRPRFAAALGRGLYNRGLHAMVVDREIVHETPATAAVTAALALAGTVALTDLAFDPPAGLAAVLGKTDAEFYRVDLSGRGEAELCFDVDELGIVPAVQTLIEALLPRLRQTWTAV